MPLEALSSLAEVDPTIPPLSKVAFPSKLTLLVHLNTERPLSEPKWVKTGDVQEWLKSEFGRMFWVAGDASEGWEKKIEVVDPAVSFYCLQRGLFVDASLAAHDMDDA